MTIEPGRHGYPYQPPMRPPQFNYTYTVIFKGGWPGLFTGESQTKAVDRVLRTLNAQGHRVAAAADDRWSIWKRIGMAFLALVTLGFYVRVPNIILITEPLR